MAFSPDGRQLAFVTVEPITVDEATYHQAGRVTYRLMIVSGGQRLRVVEETRDWMLSGPGYSRDGRRLCYLRIPLLTEEQLQELVKAGEERMAKIKAGPATTQPEGMTVPVGLIGKQQAQLVIRDAKGDRIISTTAAELPVYPMAAWYREEGVEDVIAWDYYMSYILTRPQFGPGDKSIHFGVRLAARAVEPETGKQRVEGTAKASWLCPDGKTVAAIGDKWIAFIPAVSGKVTQLKWTKDVAPKGVAWLDDRTLVVIGRDEKKGGSTTLYFLTSDGGVARSVGLEEIDKNAQGENTIDLAIAPNGRNMVLCFGKQMYFMTTDGKVIKRWVHGDEEASVMEPTFSPDSTRVACKYLVDIGEKRRRTAAILFFSPEGKGLGTVDVPPVKPAGKQ